VYTEEMCLSPYKFKEEKDDEDGKDLNAICFV
jgi:hypothetical protein